MLSIEEVQLKNYIMLADIFIYKDFYIDVWFIPLT